MRIKAILLTLSLALCALSVQAQSGVFEKLDLRKDIQAVHVSKSLLSMMSQMDIKGADIAHLADKLKQIDAYTSETADAATFMKAQADLFAKNKAYETFMTVKEKTQTTIFYGQKNGDKFKELIMVVTDDNKCMITRFVGDFTAKDIQQVINK